MNHVRATIGGKSVPAEQTFGVVDPATGEVFAQCPDCSPSQLDQAVRSAADAFKTWGARPLEQRREVLLACADAITARAAELGDLLSREQGKPLAKAVEEAHIAAYWFRGVADLPMPRVVLHEDENARIEQLRKPLGVVGAITAWNFPLLIAAFKIAPALLAGNTVVLKPSPYTPLSTLALGEVLREIVPPGVVNVVAGGDELGARMTSHVGIEKLTFTGSIETGKKVAEAGARHLARVTLELGGNDAAIVLPDVDVKQVASKIFAGAFDNAGQVCIAIKRVYVHESIAEELTGELVDLALAHRVGPGVDPDSQMGPLNNKAQLDRVIELVEDARKASATVRCGGKRLDRKGFFYPPTILTNVKDEMRIVREEQFGPVLPILTFSDVQDAIVRANATEHGLGGSVWTKDLERGASIAAQLSCGTAWVNQAVVISPGIPFGGAKSSGIGVEGGREGIDAFTQIQIVNVSKV